MFAGAVISRLLVVIWFDPLLHDGRRVCLGQLGQKLVHGVRINKGVRVVIHLLLLASLARVSALRGVLPYLWSTLVRELGCGERNYSLLERSWRCSLLNEFCVSVV